MSKRRLNFSCAECPTTGKVFCPDTIIGHYRDHHYGLSVFRCGVCGVAMSHMTSMIRHTSTEQEDTAHLTDTSGASGLSETSNVETSSSAQSADAHVSSDNILHDNSTVSDDDINVPTQVTKSFQYVSIIDTLNPILSKKCTRNNIVKDLASKDVFLPSFVDGYEFKNHPFLTKYENVPHLCIFLDDLEIH